MPDNSLVPSPVNQSTDVNDYALSGSFDVGAITVHHITDGLTFGVRSFWFNGIEPSVWMEPLGLDDPATPFPVNFGLFVVVGDSSVTLVDCGFGPAINDLDDVRAGNEMLDRLLEIGVRPEDVDHIVLTHMHTDHCGQLVTDHEDGSSTITFPSAQVHLHERELAYWTGPASDDNPMSGYVRSRILPVLEAGLVATYTERTAITDGVTAVPMVGHTDGHTCVLVSDEGENCLLVGDLAHHPIHFTHHDWLPVIDAHPSASIEARRRLTDLAIELDAIVTAPHMPILTLGRLSRASDGTIMWSHVAAD